MMGLFAVVLCTLWTSMAVLTQSQGLAPPPSLGRPYENMTDISKTMDEFITGTMGGVGAASNMFLAADNHVLAELDMILTEEQFLNMYEPQFPSGKDSKSSSQSYNYISDDSEDNKGRSIRTKRKATIASRLRWTNGEIPYLFARGHFEAKEEYMVKRSMTEWERYTCLKMRPAVNKDKNSVRFQNGVGCNSLLGMDGGVQALNLQAPGCRYKGLYLHEIGHAIGLVHEHQLPDRDSYISILYHNVDPNMRVWFNKYTSEEVNQMDVPYEYSSVMHYGITAFSANGNSQTIRAHDASKEKTIGRVYLKELAYTDVQIVNLMYNCSDHCPNKKMCGPEGHLDQNCRCICRDGSSDCDKTKSRPDGRCVNLYDSWSCYIWANQGECERNAYYMNQQCAKACGVCGTSADNQGGCRDVYDQAKCQVWKGRGDCVTNERWMKLSCQATCGLCGDAATQQRVNCNNVHTDSEKCDEWAKEGECSVNSVRMFNKCKKSCALCDVSEIDGGEDNGEVDEEEIVCENRDPSCEGWASKGECQNNPDWMISNCREACQKCDDNTCKNLFDDARCRTMAAKLECVTQNDWMSVHCAKECGKGACKNFTPGKETTTAMTGKKSTTTAMSGKKSTTTAMSGKKSTTTAMSGKKSTTAAGPCINLHRSNIDCDIWARNDHCAMNPSWMLKNCALSCGVCSDSGRVATTEASTGSEICADLNTDCPAWAKDGNCDRNSGYHLINCKASCKNCNGCRDTNSLCEIWARSGHCERNPGYMLRQCQKSCKTCVRYSDELKSVNGASSFASKSIHVFILSLLFYTVTLFTL